MTELQTDATAKLGGSTPAWLALGLATGVFSGLLGIGGAAIIVPGLVEIMKLRQHHATGTSLIVIIPTAAVSAVVYAMNGNIDWRSVLIYSVSASIGAVLGARIMTRLSAATLRRSFGTFLIVVSIRMILG